MTAVTGLSIRFSDPSATYFEGQEVKGDVVVELAENSVIEKLLVELSGVATINWVKNQRNEVEQGAMSSASEEERYLGEAVTIYSREGRSGDELLVPAGSHTYGFCIRLPHSIPSSFTGKHGGIKYSAKATLERPFQDQETVVREFTVRNIVDLNQLPQAMRPIQSVVSHPDGLLCCIYGGIEAEWRLEKMGYISGEKIHITGEIRNNSRIKIKKSKAVLIQHIRYYDHFGRSLHERKEIGRITKGEVLPGGTGAWKEEMVLPQLPPTGLKGCNLMDMCYTMTLKLRASGISSRMESTTDIIIATIGEGQPSLPQPYSPPANRAAVDAATDLSYFI